MAVIAILALGRFGEELLEWRPGTSSESTPPRVSPGLLEDLAAKDPLKSLKTIQAGRRIINVHEHIESIDEAELVMKVMDRYGVAKTILMGSSWFTITLNQRVGFTRYDENNESLIEVAKAYPGRFEAWPTIDPLDPDKLGKLKSMHQRGATGLKLYLGHGFIKSADRQYMFHTMAMDDPAMLPIYAYCQENFLPICFHVNPGPTKPGFAEEFIAVLKQFPDLKIICPHFMLSSIKDSRLREFLDTFPNLYSDISFGHDSFLKEGLERISNDPEKFRSIFLQYPGRFMWGTDLVITAHESKTEEWTSERFQIYLDMLTKDTYTTALVPGETLHGLALGGELLERILYRNYEEFTAKRPRGTAITRKINWKRTGVAFTGRSPGEALPPPPKK